jgi:hypothetical protein
MRIDVNLEVRSGRVHICIPQADIVAEEPCLIAYDLSTEDGEILASGQDEESLLTKLAGKGHDPDSVGIFSFEGEHFNPHVASLILCHYVRIATDRVRPEINILRLFDRWHYDIRIPGYEDLPTDVCMQFELSLLQFLKADRTSTVNGQRVRRLWWRHAVLDTTLALSYVILMPGLFGLGFWGVLKVSHILESEPVPVWAVVISVASMFVVLFMSVMVNALLFGIVWALVKRRPFIESFWSRLLPRHAAQLVDQLIPIARKCG